MRPLAELMPNEWDHPVGGKVIPETGGAFKLGKLRIIASWCAGWDHVSVSLPDRTPTWEEMEQVKRWFFRDDELVMQVHVPPAEHINVHQHCLHLWRPHLLPIPKPPAWMVG